MKLQALMIATALTFAACDSSNGQPSSNEQEPNDEVGTLALNLIGSDTDGRQYRLRSAEFLITSYYSEPFPIPSDGGSGSYFEQTVSSEDNLDEARISLKVVPGYYQISLTTPDWYLERNNAGTWERVEQAVLLSSYYQSAFVYNQAVVAVNFRFGVDGTLIDFRSGDLSIGIEIEQPGEGPGDAGFPGGGILGGLFGGGTMGGLPGGGGFAGGTTGGGGVIDAGIE
jgi:hypothetical protein